MKRLGLVVALVVVVVMVAPAVAWGQPIPLCNGRPACGSGWYTSPVTVSWDLDGGTNVGGCATQAYNQDTNQSGWVENPADLPPWAYCITNVQGGSDTRYFFIKVELSAPTATVAPSRPPDSNGWYNQPVTGMPSASAFSGIASCTSTTYAGPDTTIATVSAACVDNAGKAVTATSAPFAYDVTPPTLAITASPADKRVALNWQTGGDLAPTVSVRVTRISRAGHASPATIYSGAANHYVDTDVRNGVHYTYTITAIDQAGHSSVQAVGVTPGPRLLSPIRDAHLSAPPMLTWTPVPHASYYNVQLFRKGKVLSIWPDHASLQLRRRWRFEGHRYRLAPGRYRWFVWPGFGKRSAGRYGHKIGSGTFVVVG
jgi:hypothetical protein